MKSVAYIIPYFGRLPGKGFELWLMSCKNNPTINWIIFTDDKTPYDYPNNVQVNYCTFDDIKKRIQNNFDFKISLERGYKLCDFRPAYGKIFANELKGYDFWGHCDIDLAWGDIRKFLTDDIFNKYDRIGNKGHSSLYRNTAEINSLYRRIIPEHLDYKTALSSPQAFAFDEVGMDDICKALDIPVYRDVIYANLTKYETYFHLDLMPEHDEYKNKRQVLIIKDGKAIRKYLHDGKIYDEEYLYIHFWCRPLTYRVKHFDNGKAYLAAKDIIMPLEGDVTAKMIKKYGRAHPISFYAKSIWQNRKKLTPKRIIFNIKGSLGLNK